jgi:hypothetical protein
MDFMIIKQENFSYTTWHYLYLDDFYPENGDSMFLEKLIITYLITECHNPENYNTNLHCRDNPKSHTLILKSMKEMKGIYQNGNRFSESE